MALLPIRFALKLGDWTIFAAEILSRDEDETEVVTTSFGFETEVSEQEDDAYSGR